MAISFTTSLLVGIVAFLGLCITGLLPQWILSHFATVGQYIKGTAQFEPERKRKFEFSEVFKNVYVGRQPRDSNDLQKLKELGVKALVVLNEEKELYVPSDAKELKNSGLERLHIPVPDYQGPNAKQLKAAVEFMHDFIQKGESVYIHCNGGKGRSASVAVAYILFAKPEIKNFIEAAKIVKEKRPNTSGSVTRYPASSQARGLHEFEKLLREPLTDLKSNKRNSHSLNNTNLRISKRAIHVE